MMTWLLSVLPSLALLSVATSATSAPTDESKCVPTPDVNVMGGREAPAPTDADVVQSSVGTSQVHPEPAADWGVSVWSRMLKFTVTTPLLGALPALVTTRLKLVVLPGTAGLPVSAAWSERSTGGVSTTGV